MMEILFSESACGSLKMAQRYGEGTYQGGCMGVFISHADGRPATREEIEAATREAKEKARLAWERAVPMGGNASDIFGFNLMLSLGDISEDQPGIKRQQTLEHLYSVYPNDEGRQAAKEILHRAQDDLRIIRERFTAGEALRLWYSDQPDEMCGLYWFMGLIRQWNQRHQRKGSDEQVTIVKLPEWETDEQGNLMRKTSWSEVAPEEWQRYLAGQKTLLPMVMESFTAHWRGLQAENAPLRALLNGQLISMQETLYDDVILREIAAENEVFREAVLIGRVLGSYQLGISDGWVALRIEAMIHAGKLEVVAEGDRDLPMYHRVLRRVRLDGK